MNPTSQASSLEAQDAPISRTLAVLDPIQKYTFIKPVKRINEGQDVPAFLSSKAYSDIGTFIMQLNIAMCPRKNDLGQIKTLALDSDIAMPEPVRKLQEMLKRIDAIIEEAPPDTGPRRFGNVSFRKWYELLEDRARTMLEDCLPRAVLDFKSTESGDVQVLDELIPYFMGGFGSPQRLDYGTGHELSFLAFLGCIWKLGGFTDFSSKGRDVERSLVVGVIEPYLRVIRRLILTYTLEPAGSHGVWGLDDHFFIPYILGSSQYCPAIMDNDPMPIEGSLPDTPKPGDIVKKTIVDRERKHNIYFSAVGFINDVKTGPFWEHSPILFDISGVQSGWGKINKGMIKMYNAEVLSKFPVVQHFPFGSLFSWDQDPNPPYVQPSVHHSNQPDPRLASSNAPIPRPHQESTRAPWAHAPSGGAPSTAAPWARSTPGGPTIGAPPTRAPWASQTSIKPPMRVPGTLSSPNAPPTKAPWADQDGS